MRSATPTLNIPDGAFTLRAHGGRRLDAGSAASADPSEIEKVTINYTWTLMTPLLRPFFTTGS